LLPSSPDRAASFLIEGNDVMPRLRALRSWADRKAGEEFDASDLEARLLCAPDGLGGQKATIADRSMKAAERSDPPPEPPAPATKQQDKRRYLRRDLRAQS
jgi:hypothetical protein